MQSLNKKGISLMVLVITIIVIIIIASITIVSTKNSIDNSKLTAFASDIKEIEDATESYYLTNNQMPVPDSNKDSINKDALLVLSGSDNTSKLGEELGLNGDGNTDSEFYEIDLSKINVTNASNGTKTLGNNDVYYVAYPSMDVYYLRGISAKGDKFFSLSSKISNYTKVGTGATASDSSTTEVLSANGVSITREKSWTNTMPIIIKTNMASNETLFLSISSGIEKQVNTTEGQYDKSFNLTDLFSTNDVLLNNQTFAYADINSDKQYIEVIKKKDAVEVSRIKIDLSKFDLVIPTIANISSLTYTNMNTVKFDISDDKSGIKSIRYNYLTKIDDNGTEQPYYSGVISFDVDYMKTKAKRAKIVEGQTTVILNVPKNVNQVSYLIEDNAGNYILQGTRIAPIVNISTIVNNFNLTGFDITSNIYSTNGISNVKFSYSTDGTTYSNEQSYDLNTNDLTTSKAITFTGSNLSKVYLKSIVIDNNAVIANRKTETNVYVVDSSKVVEKAVSDNAPVLATGMTPIKWDASGNVVTTTSTDTSWYNYANKQWANAQTADGSMWVWIPRYEYKIPTPHTSDAQTIDVKFITATQTTADNGYIVHPAFTFGSTELTGIWVAKFEASGTTSAVDVKPGVASLRSITISDMFTASRNMETNSRYGWGTSGSGIDTHLIKNTEWGAVAYLTQSIYGKNSEVWINPNSNFITGQAGTSVSASLTTSTYAYNNTTYGVNASTTGNVYGIYDMSGGALEYTAAYVNNSNSSLTTYGSILVNADAKYKDIYTSNGDTQSGNYTANSSIKGDAVYETSSSYSGITSWYSDYSYMPCSSNPVFARGGRYSGGASAGLFTFYCVGNGSANSNYGFRPVLAAGVAL